MDAPRDRRRRGASRTALLLATSVAACGGTRSTPAKPALGPAEFAELDDLGGPAGAGPSGPSGPREPARTARAAAAPTLVAGHADARYEFANENRQPLSGVGGNFAELQSKLSSGGRI